MRGTVRLFLAILKGIHPPAQFPMKEHVSIEVSYEAAGVRKPSFIDFITLQSILPNTT
jgi:hypothetical protein